jgi:hypothetical protein
MENLMSSAAPAMIDAEAPRFTPDFFLEIEPRGQGKFFRLPVHVKELTDAGVILELVDLPPGVEAGSLSDQVGIIHLAPDGFSRETQFRTTVNWVRQGEDGPPHYLLGLDLQEADFRFRRSLENFLTRPKDMSHLWTYWDQAQPQPAPGDLRYIFYLCAAALLGGVALQFALPESDQYLANILIVFGSLAIAGTCLLHWRRERSLAAESCISSVDGPIRASQEISPPRGD